MYDLIIIGAGPAGITAAVYAARKRMSLLVITKDIGGQAALSGDIENYTGYQFITGPDLAAKFEEHMRKFEIALKENEEVIELKKIEDKVWVKTNKSAYETNITGIFAAGDVTDVPEKQIITAAGEGAKAALSAFRCLSQHQFTT